MINPFLAALNIYLIGLVCAFFVLVGTSVMDIYAYYTVFNKDPSRSGIDYAKLLFFIAWHTMLWPLSVYYILYGFVLQAQFFPPRVTIINEEQDNGQSSESDTTTDTDPGE